MQMLLDLQLEKDYWLGTYEPELSAAVKELVQPGWVVYDVGANTGYVTLALQRAAGGTGRVFAFEALPENVERLHQNVSLNGLEQKVSVVPAAVIDRSRTVHFLTGPSNATGKAEGSAGRQEFTYGETIEVAGISLDEFVYQQGNLAPKAVKIDIEGGEVLALPGMRRVLAEARPLVLLEVHGPESARAAWKAFTSAGYRVCEMAPGYPQVRSVDALGWKSYMIGFPNPK
jgi:FkbM family methyltransferase